MNSKKNQLAGVSYERSIIYIVLMIDDDKLIARSTAEYFNI